MINDLWNTEERCDYCNIIFNKFDLESIGNYKLCRACAEERIEELKEMEKAQKEYDYQLYIDVLREAKRGN